ncbi:MAG: bifunctional proline dehydrogenase/L-glutamate gamma-semialdehyde dehydrogenase [Planctomycetales bacterium]|nr:bifunctional proline dehydrogenase/L-glutamate gamma-semialdehyde dehydrogenase [Planctomycetales bacterium]
MNNSAAKTSVENAVHALWQDFSPDDSSPYDETVQKALVIARALQRRAQELQTPAEKKQQAELDRMIQNPTDKVTLTQMTDQAFRSEEAGRAAEQLVHILDVQGIPRFFSPMERTMLKGFQSFGNYLPGVAVPLVKEQMRRETSNVILPAEPDLLRAHLEARRDEGVRMNVNFLGEAILGEDEAKRRLEQYLAALQLPEIEVVSVKISTIYSQISTIGRAASVRTMCDRMELLYRAAARAMFVRSDGTRVPKFVYMDMEEYRDMPLTADVFMQTLDRRGLENVSAGIVLQAYLPDASAMQKRITEWARARVENGGAPITLRIVKGANMEMERVEASIHGWAQAPFKTKRETDANYKRMVQFAMRPENIHAVKPGIASHNLFDLAYGLALSVHHGVFADIQFEMLEGMANHQRRALHELTSSLLLYAPACGREAFINAIGYLVRRLDENTGEENFLRHAFNIAVDSEAWTNLEQGFLDSFSLIDQLPSTPRRKQNRLTEEFVVSHERLELDSFCNEPDTDFSLPQNTEWAESIVERWFDRRDANGVRIPLFVAGTEITAERTTFECLDPSRPGTIIGCYKQANLQDAEAAIQCAKSDPTNWRSMPDDQRAAILRNVANELRKARADLIGVAIADGGKTIAESDPEVSEAIDFAEFYAATAREFERLQSVAIRPNGVVVVVSPWNFPIAIPCGGICAALAAGNTVILKPASTTVLVAHELCECFYRAGVPREVLQLIPCSGASVGQHIVAHDDVDTVILTGGTNTAERMLHHKPTIELLAETGGKNATIVSALSDRDQAIKNVLHSAFGHSGQKCSATSLLLLEDEVFEDEDFRDALVDAASSMQVGSAWDLKTRIGPLNSPPSGDLERGLKELEPGESWALMPERIDGNPCLYSPGIKWNVSAGSYTHQTEFFGPILGVMRYRWLFEAIEAVNATGYGLTSGLESLDSREQETWLSAVRAGNLYINRPTTGAIVLRQPFGGMGKSAFGPGIKAGGPNYVAQLMQFENAATPQHDGEIHNKQLKQFAKALNKLSSKPRLAKRLNAEPQDIERLIHAIQSYDYWARTEFGVQHDHFKLIGQDNDRRYLPVHMLCIRVTPNDDWYDIFARAAAAKAAGCRAIVNSMPDTPLDPVEVLHELTESWAADLEFIEQSDESLVEAINAQQIGRLRYSSPNSVNRTIRKAVIGKSVHIADRPVLDEGRIELLWYLQEQSISHNYHRYGNLGRRAGEQRYEPS